MVNQDKVALMTKAAIDEKKYARELRCGRYYRRDYVSYHVLLVTICVTLAMAIIFGATAVMFIESNPKSAQNFDWIHGFIVAFLIYIAVLAVYVVVTMIVYFIRYNRATTRIKEYTGLLKKIDSIYVKEESQRTAVRSEAEEWKEYDSRKVARRKK